MNSRSHSGSAVAGSMMRRTMPKPGMTTAAVTARLR